jgi:hypothetical protein
MTAALEELVSHVQGLTATLPGIIENVSSLSQDQFLLGITKIFACRQSLEEIVDALLQIRGSETEPDLTHAASDGSLTESDESFVLDAPPLFQDGTEEQDSLNTVYRHGNHLFTSTGQFVSIFYLS